MSNEIILEDRRPGKRQKNNVTITAEERQLMLYIWNAYTPMDEIMTPLYYLHAHVPYPRRIAMLTWLATNKVSGKNFLSFYKDKAKGSNLELVRELTRRIEHDQTGRALIYGKDMKG